MKAGTEKRAMWLLNHRTARNFDRQMLAALGITEFFSPKTFPINSQWVSADVDWSLDETLTIPSDELAVLNGANWYGNAGEEAWQIANKYFQFVFVGFQFDQLDDVTRHFKSTILLRAWGHFETNSFYSTWIYNMLGPPFVDRVRAMGPRFWFAESYEQLHIIEDEFLSRRRCYLPVGLLDATPTNKWKGHDPKIFFVCPQIGTEPFYRGQYEKFTKDFAGLPYVVGGAQPVIVPDSNVLGFVPRDVHDENMRRFRVMFYPGSHPHHVHYHPFEAVRAGMPLVFMAGGMLDQLGGLSLPGRCQTIGEARRKVERLLAGDSRLSDKIRSTQICLLDKMRPEYCLPIWRKNFQKVLESRSGQQPILRSRRRPKVAVIIPVGYRGGTLRALKLIATAVYLGSRQLGEPADVVFGYVNEPGLYTPADFLDLPADIKLRPYRWELLEQEAAERVLRYSGHQNSLSSNTYAVPNDGINNFLDCDVWLIGSDRMSVPPLPLRPVVLMIFDYLQRYVPLMQQGVDLPFIEAARSASSVLVRTRFAQGDAEQYAGVHPNSIRLVPPLCPVFERQPASVEHEPPYFLWHTNLSPHKNQVNALSALRLYYEKHDGTLKCGISGVDSHKLFSGEIAYLEPAKAIMQASQRLQRNVTIMGELPDAIYQKTLGNAQFLWHTAIMDDGTLAAVEAVSLGVPVLSTDYPPMRELDEFYDLRCVWSDSGDPGDMATKLKRMEVGGKEVRGTLPSHAQLKLRGVEHVATAYWKAVRECL